MKSGEVERLWKLQTSANSLVLEGKRDADLLLEFLQRFVFGTELGSEVWHKVYKLIGMDTEYDKFVKDNPFEQDSSLWIVPVVNGATPNKVVDALRKLGVDVHTYTKDLDTSVSKNDRDPANGSYMIGFAKNVEADQENKNKSANQLAKAGHKGITLLERLILEIGYFLATGRHLDEKNVTLCSGSRNRDGNVPRVNWNPDDRKICVYWYDPDYSDDSLRSRSAVSLPA